MANKNKRHVQKKTAERLKEKQVRSMVLSVLFVFAAILFLFFSGGGK